MPIKKHTGFTIVELLIVVVVVAILATISTVAFSGIQARARDSGRIAQIQSIAKAIELYYTDNGQYPPILDGHGIETTCGSQTENWGHCDRFNILATMLSPYTKFDPTQLSNATQGSYYYWYTSQASDNYQSYGMLVNLEGNGGQNDGGYFSNAYEVGENPSYCMSRYTGTSRDWRGYTTRCNGGD